MEGHRERLVAISEESDMGKSIRVLVPALVLALAAAGAFADKKELQSQQQNINRNSGDDKQKGLDRARERMSEGGLEHSKASDVQSRKQPKPKKDGK